MIKWRLLENLLLIATTSSTISVSLIQKTKACLKCSKHVCLYSFVMNMILGVIFTVTFTDIDIKYSFWVGLFSYLGADTIYKSLEGKLTSFRDLKKSTNDNDSSSSDKIDDTEILEEIKYE